MAKETLLIGDIHMGVRNDSLDFMDYQLRTFDEVILPYCASHGIKRVIFVGDMFDKRKATNTMTLHMCRTRIIEAFAKLGIDVVILIGNHDIYYRDSLEISTPMEFFANRYSNVYVISEPATTQIGQLKVDIFPWICKENTDEVMQFISNSTSQIAIGHFEFEGFKFAKDGQVCDSGLSPKVLKNYDKVYSGHFHGKSEKGSIRYLGTPFEITWSDYDDTKGFYLFDDVTGEVDFIENPIKMFHVVEYDDEANKYTKLSINDFHQYENCVVKLIVKKKKSKTKFTKFRDMFYQAKVLDLNIIDAVDVIYESNELLTSAEAEDTETLLETSVEQVVAPNIDQKRLKDLMRDIHRRALEKQSTI